MRVKYDVLFAPKGADPDSVQDVRRVEVYNKDRYDSHDKLTNEAKKKAVATGEIDRYAIRNDYWTAVCCELQVVDSPWNSTKDLSEYLKDNHNIKSISKVRNSWSHSSVECLYENVEQRKKSQTEIENRYPGLPTANKMNYLRVTIRAKGNISLDDFRDTKPIFEEAGMV